MKPVTLVPPPWEPKKKVTEMTTEEFAAELARIRAKALHIPTADRTRVNRPKHKQMRGKPIGVRY